MKISLETLRNTRGIGSKTLERIIEQYNKDNNISEYYKEFAQRGAPNTFNVKLNQVYSGESVQFMRDNIPNSSIDMVLTSPPYDNLRDYEGYTFDYKSMLKEIYRTLKDGGVCVWVVGDATVKGSETGSSFKQALYAKEVGFNLHDTMIYAKNNPIPLTHNRYEQQFEYMFVFSKGSPKTFNPLMRTNKYKGKSESGTFRHSSKGQLKPRNTKGKTREASYRYNIWHYNIGNRGSTRDKIAYAHPAIFPEQLAEDHILSWSKEGDIVLDPMSGSGTTCKMAKLSGRQYIGIEISEEYVSLARQRIDGVGGGNDKLPRQRDNKEYT